MVPKKGLEPPHPCGYMDLNHARLPIPPLRHGWKRVRNSLFRKQDYCTGGMPEFAIARSSPFALRFSLFARLGLYTGYRGPSTPFARRSGLASLRMTQLRRVFVLRKNKFFAVNCDKRITKSE